MTVPLTEVGYVRLRGEKVAWAMCDAKRLGAYVCFKRVLILSTYPGAPASLSRIAMGCGPAFSIPGFAN